MKLQWMTLVYQVYCQGRSKSYTRHLDQGIRNIKSLLYYNRALSFTLPGLEFILRTVMDRRRTLLLEYCLFILIGNHEMDNAFLWHTRYITAFTHIIETVNSRIMRRHALPSTSLNLTEICAIYQDGYDHFIPTINEYTTLWQEAMTLASQGNFIPDEVIPCIVHLR